MPPTSRDRIIQIAHDQTYRVGFAAVGLDAILSEAGVTKTTFYKHFESKADLLREVLEWHDCWWQDTFRQMLKRHGGDTPRGQLLAVPDAFEELFNDSGFNGCFFVNVAVQFPLPHDPAHQAAAAHKRAMEAIVRELAGYAGAADAGAFAEEFTLVMEGAYVTRQVTCNPATSAIVRRLVNLIVERHLPLPRRPARSTTR
jgi:AcrR family transcriptional regulator